MQRFHHLFHLYYVIKKVSGLFVLACVLYSCTSKVDNYAIDDFSIHATELQPLSNQDYSLSLEDINTLIQVSSKTTKASDPEISAVKGPDGEEVFFLVQYSDGWQLLASDMRVPPVVAENDKGTFEDLLSNESASVWLEGMALDMSAVQHCSNDALRLTDEEINDNITYWKFILGETPDLTGSWPETKSRPDAEIGYYVLVSRVETEEIYDSLRLTSTLWDEDYPYNAYCPYYPDDYYSHAKAGDAAIAGGQMLYYLHEKDGVPVDAPSGAVVNCSYADTITFQYYMEQSDWSSTIWDDMPLWSSSNLSASPMIAHLAENTVSRFDPDHSISYADGLVDVFDEYYGISSTYDEYDGDIVKESLLYEYPVIATAARDRRGSLFHYNYSDYGTFLIDGYVRMRILYTDTYTWVWEDEDYPGVRPYNPDVVRYAYSSPYLSYIKMNWGTGDSESNETRFALTDTWVYDTSWGQIEYPYDRCMITID